MGEREVKMALRKTLFKYRLHQDQDLFDRDNNGLPRREGIRHGEVNNDPKEKQLPEKDGH